MACRWWLCCHNVQAFVWQLAQARQEIEKLKEDLAMRDAVIANFDVLGQL